MNGSGSGLFIVVEGPEGAGKSTLVRWLAARLRADGRRVVAVRQPGGTPVAEAARKLALRFPHAVAPAAELFLFLAARADLAVPARLAARTGFEILNHRTEFYGRCAACRRHGGRSPVKGQRRS